jgi:mannitol/fructose-specific phosphotransferase system IIA component (Ntr-type)
LELFNFIDRLEVEIKISDYLNKEMILDVQNINKEMALNKLIDCIITNPAIKNSKEFRQAIYAREALMSTGIGYGIAIPHARLASVSDIAICILRCVNGIEYPSIDDLPVKIIFMIAAAENQSEE